MINVTKQQSIIGKARSQTHNDHSSDIVHVVTLSFD